MKKSKFLLLPLLCLILSGCHTSQAKEKTEGEKLAEGYYSTSFLKLDSLNDTNSNLAGINIISELAGGINAGILSLLSAKKDNFAGWAASTIFKLVFNVEGEDKSQKILETLDSIDKKIDEINKKLDQVILRLDSVLEKQELNALKSDINTLRNGNAYLQTYIDYTKNLSIGKESSSSLDEEIVKKEYEALNKRFPDAPTKVNEYAHLLFDAGVNSGKNIFANIKRIISLNHFLFDYQEVKLKLFNDASYLAPFLYACAISYGQLNYIRNNNPMTSVEYIDANARFETTKQNVERVKKAYEENETHRRKEGFISFLYPDNEKYIPFYNRIRTITSDSYVNYQVDQSKLGDKKYWQDWVFAKSSFKNGEEMTPLYAVKGETINTILECISSLVKTRKRSDRTLTNLFSDAGFEIPPYSGTNKDGLRFFTGDDFQVYSSYEDTFFQVTSPLSGNRAGSSLEKDKGITINFAIGSVEKSQAKRYGWQTESALLLTNEKEFGYDSSLSTDISGNIV